MRRVLLDTSAYSAFRLSHAGALREIQEADEIFVNAIIIGELLAGARRGKRREKNERELDEFLASPRVRVADMGVETGRRYAAILHDLWEHGTPIPTNDMWIAATAMEHGLNLLTADKHFERVGQIIVEPLET